MNATHPTFRPSPLTDCPIACRGCCGDDAHGHVPCPNADCNGGRVEVWTSPDDYERRDCATCEGDGLVHVDYFDDAAERVPCCMCADASCALCDVAGLMAVEVALAILKHGVAA
jgi:hypothetical protein